MTEPGDAESGGLSLGPAGAPTEQLAKVFKTWPEVDHFFEELTRAGYVIVRSQESEEKRGIRVTTTVRTPSLAR